MRFRDIRQTFIKGDEIPNDLIAKPRLLADTKENRERLKRESKD